MNEHGTVKIIVAAVVGVVGAWTLRDVATLVSIFAGLATALLALHTLYRNWKKKD